MAAGDYVNENSNIDDSGTPATSIAVTLNGVAAGNSLVVFVGHSDAGSTTGVNDGNAYTQAGSAADDVTNSQASDAWYFLNHAGGNITVTASFSGSIAYRRIRIAEYEGALTFDTATQQAQASPGTGTDGITSGNITTAEANERVVAWTQNTSDGTTIASPGTGYTARGTGVYQDRLEDKIQATAGSTAGTFTQAVNAARTTHVLAFKMPAGPPPPEPSRDYSLLGSQRNRPGRGPYSFGKYFRPLTMVDRPASGEGGSGFNPAWARSANIFDEDAT